MKLESAKQVLDDVHSDESSSLFVETREKEEVEMDEVGQTFNMGKV
jgi:hypothetical protein